MTVETPTKNEVTPEAVKNETQKEMQNLNTDVGKWISERLDEASKSIGSYLNAAGQWLNSAFGSLSAVMKSALGAFGIKIGDAATPASQEKEKAGLDTHDKIAENGKFLERLPLDPKNIVGKLPASGELSFYGHRGHGQHNSIDIPTPQGSPVYAGFNATVTNIVPVQQGVNSIVYLHDGSGNIEVKYIHLSKIFVAVGQQVTANTVIGNSGGTPGTPGAGTARGAHLHMEIKYKGVHVDPYQHLAGCPDCTSNLKA